MIQMIIKRDGRVVPYDKEKIAMAVLSAMKASGEGSVADAARISDAVEYTLEGKTGAEPPQIELIQDTVEQTLMSHSFPNAAKAYIIYRATRTRARESRTSLMLTINEIANADARVSDLKRDNANIDGNTSMGAMLQIGAAGAKAYNEAYLLRPEHAKAYREGDIHIHDFDFYALTTTCTQIDIVRLFKDGFSTGHGYLREPQSIQSYAALAAIAIQSNQNDQHGGQSIPNFDYGMAIGVGKTFRKLYRRKLAEIAEDHLDADGLSDAVDRAVDAAEAELGQNALEPAEGFDGAVARHLYDELGIEADAEQVASQIASAKEDAGVAADDGQAWADYLAQSGDTPELYRKRVEESLIEQQLLSQEIEFGVEDEEGAQLVQQYIDENYLARIAKRWSVLRYDTRKKAKAVLNSLADLEGAELKRAFEALLDSDDSEDTTRANGGDLGWDVALDMGSVQDDLNAEKVNPVHVSKDVHKQNGAFYVMMCTDRYVFERDSTYEDIPDEDLRSFILESATYENWSTLREEYLNKLVDEANVQVTPMPDGLDYDVDDLLATM